MEYEDKICDFKDYVKQTLDLLVDAYKWKMMANECEQNEIREKYMSVSNILFELFMTEHNNIGAMFKDEE